MNSDTFLVSKIYLPVMLQMFGNFEKQFNTLSVATPGKYKVRAWYPKMKSKRSSQLTCWQTLTSDTPIPGLATSVILRNSVGGEEYERFQVQVFEALVDARSKGKDRKQAMSMVAAMFRKWVQTTYPGES